MATYTLDSDTLIRAKNFSYAPDLIPEWWDWLRDQMLHGHITMTQFVVDELLDGEDEISDWLKDHIQGTDSVVSPCEQTQKLYGEIVDYVLERYEDGPDRRRFLNRADPWIIAHAGTYDLKVITHEVPADDAVVKVKLPTVCKQFGVEWTEIYSVMRDLDYRNRKRLD